MKYALVPQSPSEEAVLAAAPHLRVLLEPFVPLVAARALLAFVRLGLPAALAGGGRRLRDLAEDLELDGAGLEHLLTILAVQDFVVLEEGNWTLTPLSRTTLLAGSPAPLDAWIAHNRHHWRALAGLEEALKRPDDRDLHHRLDSPEDWAVYQRAMLQTALPAADAVARALPAPPECRTILDLGGSHGLYGDHIRRRFPGARCRVLDLPEALSHARAAGREAGLGDGISWEACDLRDADLGENEADVAFLGNVVHHLEETALADLLARVRRALRPGGVIAIWDMAARREGTDLVAAGFSLLFHLTSATPCRSAGDHLANLTAAGFVAGEVRADLSPTHALVTARRRVP